MLASISNEGLNKAQTVAPDRGEIGERAIILVSDSALTLVSGSKRNPKHTSPSDTFQAYLSSMVQPGYGEVRMEDKWGARLIHLVGRVEAIMDELIEATGDRFAAIDVMVVWSGNELVGSRGVFVNPDPYCREVRPDESWDEVHGAQGNIREIAGGIQRAFRVLAAIRRRPRMHRLSPARQPSLSSTSLETMHRSITCPSPSMSSTSTLRQGRSKFCCWKPQRPGTTAA